MTAYKSILSLATLALVTVACSNPTAPTPVRIEGSPVVIVPQVGTILEGGPWPVLIGTDGKEDPTVPPMGDECYTPYIYPFYGGWNWVCSTLPNGKGDVRLPYDLPVGGRPA